VKSLALAIAITVAPIHHSTYQMESVRGIASWYRYIPGHAAAGPTLRRALGSTWRGKVVKVCRGDRCFSVRLTDWCQCYGMRLIDLTRTDFARIASPSRGLVKVEVTW
jgi:rare lipoprotein A (peptidoglycan hydrolase)